MTRILLIGAVRGLEEDGRMVARAIDDFRPGKVGISLSRESLEAMAKHFDEGMEMPEACNFEEEMYIEGLGLYGRVIRPPPCFSEAWRVGRERGIQMVDLDMDDEHFTAAYCRHISTLEMVLQGRSQKRWARYAFNANNAREFVLEWDRLINKLAGFKELEDARERWMAKKIRKMSEDGARALVVVDYERFHGVASRLRDMELEFQALETDS